MEIKNPQKHSASMGKNLQLSMITNSVNTLALVSLFGGAQIILFIALTQNFWFTGLYFFIFDALLITSIAVTIIMKHPALVQNRFILLFLILIVPLCLALLFSENFISSDQYAQIKFVRVLRFVIIPSLWGIVFKEGLIDKKALILWNVILLGFGNLFIFFYFSDFSGLFLRIGLEANSIQLSYAFANLWVFILVWMLERKKTIFPAIIAIIALFNVFIFSTRQAFVYLVFSIVLLFFHFLNPFFLRWNANAKVYLRTNRLKKLFGILLIFLVVILSFEIISPLPDKVPFFQITSDSALQRWNYFFEEGYVDYARASLFKEGFATWSEHLFFGSFAYERPGSNAHHLLDLLAQYGLFGGIAYGFLITLALYRVHTSSKKTLLTMSFSPMFLALLFLGITVTSLTLNPTFHFLLFYWLSRQKSKDENQVASVAL